MGVWESNGIEKNFDELVEEIQKVKHWYSKSKYILLSAQEEFYKNLEDKSLVSQFKSDDGWRTVYFKIYISEDNEDDFVKFKQILDVIYQADQETHRENLRIVEDNRKTKQAIFDILEKVGIRSKYYGYKTSRSTKQTEMYYKFPSEISNQIPTYYSENSLDERKKELLSQMNKYWDQEISKIRQERLKKEQEQKEKEKNRKLALLLAKYDLSLDCDWRDVLEVILDKNKYLRLAHYLEKNRGDWSNGCDYAEIGLRGFEVENELDQKIYDDIQWHIDHWEGDGRVFRDCEYNYSVLYGIAEEQDSSLVSDYYEVKKYIGEYY